MGDLKEATTNGLSDGMTDRLKLHRQHHEQTVLEKLRSIEETADYLRSTTSQRPKIAVICGTGLGGLADLLTDTDVFPYDQIPNFLIGSVPGHAGKLIFGNLAGKSIVCMQGRVHAYEGNPMWKTTFPIRVFAALGVKVLLATNASGGLNPSYSVGDVMLLKDHINLAGLVGLNPFVGLNDERFGDRFVAMSGAYDRELRELVWEVSRELEMDFLREGVYVCQVGPSFETVSESRMMITLGADAAGMSTVFEIGVARHCGMRCLGLSLITNMCLVDYDTDQSAASHEDNLASSMTRADDLKRLVTNVIHRMNVE